MSTLKTIYRLADKPGPGVNRVRVNCGDGLACCDEVFVKQPNGTTWKQTSGYGSGTVFENFGSVLWAFPIGLVEYPFSPEDVAFEYYRGLSDDEVTARLGISPLVARKHALTLIRYAQDKKGTGEW